MAQVFMSICETAPKRQMSYSAMGIIAEFDSGPHEGEAASLRRQGDQVWIEFHSYWQAAFQANHDSLSWLRLNLHLKQTTVSDPMLKNLYSESFSILGDQDLGMLIPARRNLLQFVQKFIGLIPHLPCHHIWQTEFETSWEETSWAGKFGSKLDPITSNEVA